MVAHAGPLEIGPELLSLAVCTAIAFAVSQQLFRWEPEAKIARRAKLWAASAIILSCCSASGKTAHGSLRSTAHTDYLSIERPAQTNDR